MVTIGNDAARKIEDRSHALPMALIFARSTELGVGDWDKIVDERNEPDVALLYPIGHSLRI